ncbi:uncharacterized protein si:dkey-32e6.3 [Oncorhynchus tshawytscha]|uniref:Uncharacterized protein n=1 Tax=Oncorhynchus tshawytscha TaxID=74940 RepID=A0AAZ3QZT9_ONCTS|nr:uncharacterized protein si:dkey-32e6.3 [Oncorhynchus tshawytscha]XP_042155355.1 uncharacterized protein si:dkey-32e6.3 [Oncorhynchus tshawytscha]
MAYCDKTGDHPPASLNNEDSRNGHDPATDKHPTPHSKGNANDCCSTEEARTVSVPHGLCVKKKKLVLHVDLNNTILVSDAVTSQGTIAALDYFISTVTWGQMSKQGKWMWMSDSPSLLPPCEGAVSYYSQFGRVAGFTSSTAGQRFRCVLDEHLAMLRWPKELKGDKELAVKGEDGQLYHWILPSFFQLLKDLVAEGRDFAILFRTFGSDLPRVLSAVSRALTQGSHPLFPDLPALKLSVNETPGQIRCSKKGAVLTRAEERLSTRDGERALYQYLSSVQCLGGFQDHFDWWARNTYSILGGKPLWVDPFDQDVQHIFIDDNIRQNDKDTIVHPKVFLDRDGSETRTASTSELYDLCLVQNDLLKAISDPEYFTQRISICQENYDRNLQQGAG